jgi:hypothetical protein
VLAGQIDLPIARIGGKLIGNHLQKLASAKPTPSA